MNTQEKAKRYDEAIKYAQYLMNERCKEGTDGSFHCSDLQKMFPELRESEDERIKEELLNYLYDVHDDDEERARWIDWLEKQGNLMGALQEANKKIGELVEENYYLKEQGEQKPIDPDTLIQQRVDALADIVAEQKPTDKIEPKFKVGDWVIDKQGIVHQIYNVIENVTNHTYTYNIVGGGYFNDNTEGVRLWTIQDAKDGDILACNKEILLFKSYSVQDYISLYCWYNGQTNNFHSKEVVGTLLTRRNKIRPATKEQRDTLMKAMTDAGYEWDAEKLELKKIKQKSAWSEEDEDYFDAIIAKLEITQDDALLTDNQMNFLKSLKERVQPQHEWKQENTDDLTDFENAMMHIGSSFFGQHAGLDPNDTNAIKEQANVLLGLVSSKEWNYNDEVIIETIIQEIEKIPSEKFIDNAKYRCLDWLRYRTKSLRPQNRWEPSDEQMKQLHKYCPDNRPLTQLYQDLKKLMEE